MQAYLQDPFNNPVPTTAINWSDGKLTLSLRDVQRGRMEGFEFRQSYSFKDVDVLRTKSGPKVRELATNFLNKTIQQDFSRPSPKNHNVEYIGGESTRVPDEFKRSFALDEVMTSDSMPAKIFRLWFKGLGRTAINWETGAMTLSYVAIHRGQMNDCTLTPYISWQNLTTDRRLQNSNGVLFGELNHLVNFVVTKYFSLPTESETVKYNNNGGDVLPKKYQRDFTLKEIVTTQDAQRTMALKIFKRWLQGMVPASRTNDQTVFDLFKKKYSAPKVIGLTIVSGEELEQREKDAAMTTAKAKEKLDNLHHAICASQEDGSTTKPTNYPSAFRPYPGKQGSFIR